jgi:hypothetical protein
MSKRIIWKEADCLRTASRAAKLESGPACLAELGLWHELTHDAAYRYKRIQRKRSVGLHTYTSRPL